MLTSEATPVAVDRHDGDGLMWEMARRGPHPALGAHVQGYCGYTEDTDGPFRRREVANGAVALILSFGEPLDIVEMSNTGRESHGTFTSFAAGLHEGYAITEHCGSQAGVQIDLTPLGAYQLLGLPMREIANRVVDLTAVWGRQCSELADRMASAPGWAERLDVVDELLLRWSEDGPTPDPAVTWAWNQLDRSNGMVSVSALADEIGWSRRHFGAKFREQVGLSPKPAGRVLRFRRAVELLTAAAETPPERQPTIADVAAACGYADHSHLVRECRSLGGVTPTELMGAVLPDASGITG